MTTSQGSNEFFYLDKNGAKQDAALHEEILDNPEADKRFTEMVARLEAERPPPAQEDLDEIRKLMGR